MSDSSSPIDYTTYFEGIVAQLTIIANALSSDSQLGEPFRRAMTVSSLKSSGQLQGVINEMNNPTALPGGN